MRPGNNFFLNLFSSKWGVILFFTLISLLLIFIPFHIGSFALFGGVFYGIQLIMLADTRSEEMIYAHFMVMVNSIFLVGLFGWNVLTFDDKIDRYVDVNTTDCIYFYENEGDKKSTLYFVKNGSKEVTLDITISDNELKDFLSTENPKLYKHETKSAFFQTLDNEYTVSKKDINDTRLQ